MARKQLATIKEYKSVLKTLKKRLLVTASPLILLI
jgi:hypothetical protein